MTPILYYNNTRVEDMTTNGIGRLSDCISCYCTEERNGIYEIEFEYPVTGKYYDQINIGRIVSCIPSEDKNRQPFIIYRRTAEINGIVTFNAYHYSYLLSYAIMPHQTYTSLATTLKGFEEDTLNYYTNLPHFKFYTDKSSNKNYTVPGIASIKSLLYGQEGSILDVYGTGEYEYDGTDVYLRLHRGQDNGVVIRYGKNLLDLSDEIDATNLYNGVVAFWADPNNPAIVRKSELQYADDAILWEDENGNRILDENSDNIEFKSALWRLAAIDASQNFQSEPSTADLNAFAIAYLDQNQPWIPKRNIKVDFAALWQTEEYKNVAPAEKVKLCDTVHIIYEELGVVATAKVIKTVWNVLLDRYDSIEVGQVLSDYRGYNGDLKIGDRVYKIINGIISTVR